MLEIAIDLSEEQQKRLAEIARANGKTTDQLVHEAVDRLITPEETDPLRADDEEEGRGGGDPKSKALGKPGFPNGDRLEKMRQGRGIWKDRQDLPSLEELRRESNRYS